MSNQEETQILQERLDQLAGQICEAWEQIRAAFQDALNAIRIAVRRFTREVFAARLICAGLPAFLAEFIADRLPWRWMSVEWIYRPWFDR